MKKTIVYNKLDCSLKINTHTFEESSKLELAKEEAEELSKLYPNLLTLSKKKKELRKKKS